MRRSKAENGPKNGPNTERPLFYPSACERKDPFLSCATRTGTNFLKKEEACNLCELLGDMLRNNQMGGDPNAQETNWYSNSDQGGQQQGGFQNPYAQQQPYYSAPQQLNNRGEGMQFRSSGSSSSSSMGGGIPFHGQASAYAAQAPGGVPGDDGAMDFKNKGMYGVDEDYSNEPPLLEELGIHFDHIWLKTLSVIYPSKDLGHLAVISKMTMANFIKFALSGGKAGVEGLGNTPTVNANISLLNNRELDSDLTGPIMYCLLLGVLMLFRGKVNFGYIYGFSVICSILLHQVLLLLQTRLSQSSAQALNMGTSPSKQKADGAADDNDISIWETCSILGYSLIPVVILAGIAIVIDLRQPILGTSSFPLAGVTLCAGAVVWSTYSATRLLDVKMFLTANHQYWLVAYPVAMFYICFTLITVF